MKLDPAARMDLMRFVCSFAWTDLRVQQSERDLVMRVAGSLGLSDAEVRQVAAWLRVPPRAEEVDPMAVPREHREAFLAVADAVAKADGKVVPAERDALGLFRDLLKG